ncbi:MAG: pseudouridine synthase [Sulfuricurvum sp. RIFOXYD2_FULL_44_160]|jgi:23S rRNA pseudouridine2605 synthase|uniref:Pseudouridine synthase n=2 Tax=Sulfuricurvum kujiense TaxID=148813 RepID=A0A2D3WGE0_9BACT|nr:MULTISPECIES: pseudouridine synthase [unclassified Sulfuricurvum]OHD92124.1 MAG: pseudouridine synthase [Sulfuricurvum sp. RIFOXYD2_FULL_44_160]OHD94661.1 MAG: pseudouridine synthase [Sulfuricurvum sp. RIFOXYD12_FULL_44_77]DAB38965.1 MAG TPA: pseudouridine synthase [Sulfuricurvum kujiense]
MMRLNKYIAHYSTYSRREADQAILDGYVRIDGEVETNPAIQVDERNANVMISGNKIVPSDQFTVIVYNKPRGELVTKKDPQGRKTIYDSLAKQYRHYIPVGRLDFASEGLLLLTDASRVATALMTSKMERVYKIKIKGPVTEGMKIAMGEGLELEDASAGAHEHADAGPMSFAPFYAYQVQKDQGDYSILKVAIGEGQNRELRRFFAHFGAEIVDLKRLSFGGIELNNLPTGKVRFLERSEYSNLREFLDAVEKAEKQKQKNEKKAPRAEGKPEHKPAKTFTKDKAKAKAKPSNEPFSTNKYKPDSKFSKGGKK